MVSMLGMLTGKAPLRPSPKIKQFSRNPPDIVEILCEGEGQEGGKNILKMGTNDWKNTMEKLYRTA